jgi:signal transduction histidine kinase
MGVSHELRTPLTVIRVAADNIANGMMENSRHAQKYGQLIGDEARRLTEMVEQILTFARARSGNGAELKSVPPEQIVSRALAACAPVLRDAGMIVEREIDPHLPEVQGDLNLMVDCVQNLINNAVKYAKSGGWVRVRAEKAPDSGGSRIRIAVEDRGPGVSPDDLPHIFDPFYRGEGVRSSQILGVGLGLSLVKRIVEAHHGTVTVESSSGLGATFYLYLPAQPPQVQPAGEMKQVTS